MTLEFSSIDYELGLNLVEVPPRVFDSENPWAERSSLFGPDARVDEKSVAWHREKNADFKQASSRGPRGRT